MVHVIASIGFFLTAASMVSLIAMMLIAEQDKIAAALGLRAAPTPRPAQRAVRVRSSGRWSAMPARAAAPYRAAA